MLDPAGVGIALAGRGDDGRIDQGSRLDPGRPGLELVRHGGEKTAIEPVADQRLAETHEGGALRSRFGAGEATEAAEGRPVVESLGEFDVRQIVPRRNGHCTESFGL